MMVLLGNSGSPRWYDGDPVRFAAYVEHIRACGATATELVVHHGPADERTGRVHVLQHEWEPIIDHYRQAGLAVQLHGSLDPRFALERWLDDPHALQSEYEPILTLLGELAADQGRAVLVVHGAAARDRSIEENLAATRSFMLWLADELERRSAGACAALELSGAKASRPTAAARSRASVLEALDPVDSARVGICWDLAHDVENGSHESGWALVPDDVFLSRVVHVHAHDLDGEGEAHYPLVFGRVPVAEQLAALAGTGTLPSITLEVRYRCAARLGDPWDLLCLSYAEAARAVQRRGAGPGEPSASR